MAIISGNEINGNAIIITIIQLASTLTVSKALFSLFIFAETIGSSTPPITTGKNERPFSIGLQH